MEFREQKIHSKNNVDLQNGIFKNRVSHNRATQYGGTGCKLIPNAPR